MPTRENGGSIVHEIGHLNGDHEGANTFPNEVTEIEKLNLENQKIDSDLQVHCFTEVLHDATLHFQILRLAKQIYIWIGCKSSKFGHLYAAAPTRPSNLASVTSLIGGSSDSSGPSIARRLVLKTGLNVILACNIPKNSPMIEADAEGKLLEKLKSLGYVRPKPGDATHSSA
ncbi:hypothetical protein AMTRI_Chr02g262920 [Amborella trichopoda]